MSEEKIHILKEMPPRNPTNGTFELTVRCNLHCKMCAFRHADCENAELMQKELTAQQWIDMARQAAEAGTLTLLLTGGEPMLRPDFYEIYEGIYQQGFLLTLYTNATMVTDKIMETLRKYPPHKIGVTLYGASPETYGVVCGNPDALAKAINGMHQLQTLPSEMEFRTTIIKDNFSDVDAMDQLVKCEFGPETRITHPASIYKAVRGACADVDGCRVDSYQMHLLHVQRKLNVIKEFVGEEFDERNVCAREEENGPVDNKRAPMFGCPAGMSAYTITYDGKMQGCQMLGAFWTNAKKHGLQEAWNQFPEVVHLPPRNEKCKNCDAAEYCQSCYASRYAETGNLNGCCDYIYYDACSMKKIYDQYRRS